MSAKDARLHMAELAMQKAHNESALLMEILKGEAILPNIGLDNLYDFAKHEIERIEYAVCFMVFIDQLRDLRRMAHEIRDTGTVKSEE